MQTRQTRQTRHTRHTNDAAVAILVGGIALSIALAAGPARADEDSATEPTRVQVDVAGTTYLKLGDRISRVSVASGDIAGVDAFPPDQVLVTGKQIGATTATVWYGDSVELIIIEVTYPLSAIRSALRKAVPNGANLDAQQAGQSLVLSGQVPSVDDIARAETIAKGFAASSLGDAPVINLMTVQGDQQVQLEVAFAEVSRSSLRQIGMNFWTKDAKHAGGLLAPTNGLDTLSPELSTAPDVSGLNHADANAVPIVNAPLSGTFGAIFSSALGGFPFSAAISLLANKGYARVMAEPTLVAMSGQTASFLAGGEFPIPLPQSLGQIGVEYKKFGIQLDFTPTVVGDTIQLAVAVTVSDIDFSLGIRLASVNVPGLVARHAQTTVRLKDGQSFVIAGLLSDTVRSNVDKVPWLGDVPILGTLFRSSSYRRDETELLVVVTAHRVHPLDERPELPGERDTVDPSDLELFLLGRHESLDAGNRPASATGKRAGRRLESSPVGSIGFKR